MPIPLRGLRTIRTLAGRVDRLFVPHRAHMRVACLEIEKARRATERITASRRVRASSPRSVQGPSASTWPWPTRSPTRTSGFWLMQVFWLERLNLVS